MNKATDMSEHYGQTVRPIEIQREIESGSELWGGVGW